MGLEATSLIRGYEAEIGLPRVPVIAMTAHAVSGDRERFLGSGMDDVLTKPLKKEALLARIEAFAPRAAVTKDYRLQPAMPGASSIMPGHDIPAVPDGPMHQRPRRRVVRVEHAPPPTRRVAITASRSARGAILDLDRDAEAVFRHDRPRKRPRPLSLIAARPFMARIRRVQVPPSPRNVLGMGHHRGTRAVTWQRHARPPMSPEAAKAARPRAKPSSDSAKFGAEQPSMA